MRILLIDNNPDRIAIIGALLVGKGHQFRSVSDSRLAWQLAQDQAFEVIIIAIDRTSQDAFWVIRQIRQQGLPVTFLVLGTSGRPQEREASLQAGADTYLAWPCQADNFKQVVRALFLKNIAKEPYWLREGELSLNLTDRLAYRQNQMIILTDRECQLLAVLMQFPDQILTPAQLVNRVWGETDVGKKNRVEVYIKYLRKKIDDPFVDKLIQTIVGAGYMLTPFPIKQWNDA